jgi:hypothetical protein
MKRLFAAALAALAPLASHAVFVNPDGTGQALIYPYYTVQSANGDAFNTYVSVVNHTAVGKALRVRVRESRAGREVASLNVYLAPKDTWTGALVPNGQGGATLISSDLSCNSVQSGQPWSIALSGAQYSGARDDGNGNGLDRTREGWIEVLEMGEIAQPGALSALAHNASGFPANCPAVEPALASGAGSVAPPAGGLSGTLTLINVANGVNFAVKAEALDQLATRSFYRPANDPYPGFGAQEVDPVSVVTEGRTTWISYWVNPFDAVSAALIRSEAWAEYVLDTTTASHTELVLTFPTRSFYRNDLGVTPMYDPPVPGLAGWAPNCDAPTPPGGEFGTAVGFGAYDREAQGFGPIVAMDPFILPPPHPYWICGSAAVVDVGTDPTTAPTALLGSTRGAHYGSKLGSGLNGWISVVPYDPKLSMQSLPRSVRIDALTGTVTTGSQKLQGLPMTGFVVRTFSNGALHCSAGTCLGNYGGAYPLDYRRNITPAS